MFQSILCGSLRFKTRLDHSTTEISLSAITNCFEITCQSNAFIVTQSAYFCLEEMLIEISFENIWLHEANQEVGRDAFRVVQ